MKTISEWVDIYNVDEETAAAIQRDALEHVANLASIKSEDLEVRYSLTTKDHKRLDLESRARALEEFADAIRALMPKENERGDE